MIIKSYSLAQVIRFARYLIHTKLICPKARLIRTPVYITGKKYIDFGKKITFGVNCRLDVLQIAGKEKPILKFGDRVQLNDYVHLCALEKVEIGNDVLIASHVYISDNSHGSYKGDENDSSPLIPPIQRDYSTAPVKIGNRVWIGEGVIIMPGSEIGEGSIIGAHSIVKGKIPENCIAVGSPAKIIKKYNMVSGLWKRTNPDGSFIDK